jgi:histidyl-tRNA synthetase
MRKVIQPVKGTRDFYPAQMAVRTWLYKTCQAVSESFGYQEYEAPMLESLELYAAKSGEELVNEQAYVFEDRSGSKLALRPELTPSLARMIAQKQNELTFPVRWWSFGPFWRYERPQKGRTREFFQWNVDLLGVDSPEADAENVAVLATFFDKVGLKPDQVMILVNDRRLMEEQFTIMGIQKKDRDKAFSWIDKKEKLTLAAWEEEGKKIGLIRKQVDQIEAMLEDRSLWKRSDNLVRFFNAIRAMGLDRFVAFDPSIARGLLYYTGTVFEAWEVAGDIKRSILGGGRYDNLLADVGGQPLPAVGFAMGDVVISLILENYGLIPKDISKQPTEVMVSAFNQELMPSSIELAANLRSAGIKATCFPEAIKLDKQLKYADRAEIPWVIIYGPTEVETNTITIKSLRTREQKSLPRGSMIEDIRILLASDSP